MKPSVDVARPRPMPMSQRLERERIRKQNLIAFDNRLLMDRLAVAMTVKNIDNELVKKPFVSLMELQRKKALTNIMTDNARLLDRIQKTVPSYNLQEWDQEHVDHVAVLKNMTEFPELFEAPGERKSRLNPTLPDYGKDNFKEPTPEERSLLEAERRRKTLHEAKRRKKRVDRIRSGPPSLNNSPFNSRNNSRPTSGNPAGTGGGFVSSRGGKFNTDISPRMHASGSPKLSPIGGYKGSQTSAGYGSPSLSDQFARMNIEAQLSQHQYQQQQQQQQQPRY